MKTDAIIKRELIVSAGSVDQPITLQIGPIEREPDCVKCYYDFPIIDTLGHYIYGEDELQALQLCLRNIVGRCENAALNGIDVWWVERGDRAGLCLKSEEQAPPNS